MSAIGPLGSPSQIANSTDQTAEDLLLEANAQFWTQSPYAPETLGGALEKIGRLRGPNKQQLLLQAAALIKHYCTTKIPAIHLESLRFYLLGCTAIIRPGDHLKTALQAFHNSINFEAKSYPQTTLQPWSALALQDPFHIHEINLKICLKVALCWQEQISYRIKKLDPSFEIMVDVGHMRDLVMHAQAISKTDEDRKEIDETISQLPHLPRITVDQEGPPSPPPPTVQTKPWRELTLLDVTKIELRRDQKLQQKFGDTSIKLLGPA